MPLFGRSDRKAMACYPRHNSSKSSFHCLALLKFPLKLFMSASINTESFFAKLACGDSVEQKVSLQN